MQLDSELVAKVLLDDDSEAFACIVKQYQSPIRSFFRKLLMGNVELADDLSQETFLLVYRNLSRFRGDAKLLTWIYNIAKNVYSSHLRSKSISYAQDGEVVVDNQSTDAQYDLVKVFSILTPEERLVLCLSYAEGLTHQEVSEMLNKPLGTVKTMILRAKERVQQRFSVKKENRI